MKKHKLTMRKILPLFLIAVYTVSGAIASGSNIEQLTQSATLICANYP
jgi:hypothetical protein